MDSDAGRSRFLNFCGRGVQTRKFEWRACLLYKQTGLFAQAHHRHLPVQTHKTNKDTFSLLIGVKVFFEKISSGY